MTDLVINTGTADIQLTVDTVTQQVTLELAEQPGYILYVNTGVPGGVTADGVQSLSNKTLLDPKLDDAILDAAGAVLLQSSATASAVNYVSVSNAATGSGPTLSAAGTDTNIDLNLAGKGSGSVKIGTYVVLTTNTGVTPSGAQTLNDKTLASAKITTGLFDSNGNELIKITATASAVNEITVANAATGSGPTISATGGDTNIDLNLAGKGSGGVKVGTYEVLTTNTGVTPAGTQTLTNKTLTSPKVGTAVLDTNGNELISVTATASAVNEITVANAATGSGPTLSATGGDTNIDLNLAAKGTGAVKIGGSVIQTAGKQTAWVPALAMTPRTTNGAARGSVETTTNKVMISTLDFDAAVVEYAQFSAKMPKGWNEGTVSAVFEWSHAATTTNFGVAWSLAAVAISDGDAIDAARGTAQTATDTGGTTDTKYSTSETSAVTIAGTPAVGDWVVFEVARQVANAGDTLAIDGRLHGLWLLYTTDATNDA